MTNVHTVRPTDLVALATYDGHVYPNEAMTRDRIGTETSPHPLETALEQWLSFATGRHTWISIKGATLRGLASARRRGSKAAWEVDCIIDAADDDRDVLTSLLEKGAADAARAGAENIFLRVASDSHIVETATRSGFSPYLSEHLMAAAGSREGAPTTLRQGLRRWGRADAYQTFRLYNVWTPEPVRRAEAVTFREWTASRERVSPARGTQQRVLERDGHIAGWVRTSADGELGRFDLMADPSTPELLDLLIDAALGRLTEQSALLTLVPDFATALCERLHRHGFREQGAFTVLARRTTRSVRLPELARAAPVQTSPT